MIDDRNWLRAVRRVTRPGMRSNQYDLEVDDRFVYNPGLGRWARNPQPIARGSCGFTADEEHDIRHLMKRVRDGVLTRECVQRELRERIANNKELESRGVSPSNAQLSDMKVLQHVLRYGQFIGRAADDFRPTRSNPQLQVLGDTSMRRNPYEPLPPPVAIRFNPYEPLPPPVAIRFNAPSPLTDLGDAASLAPSSETTDAIRLFHGSSDGSLLSEYSVDDGGSDVIELAYLGHVPAISMLSEEVGSAKKQIDVNGELVRFSGFRWLFRGKSRPILALHVPSGEAVVVQGTVDSLHDRCDSRGVLGLAPVVEYIVEAHEGSSKGEYHYVHEFAKDHEPVLRWSEELSGLVYDKDRTLVQPVKKSNPTFNKKAVYDVGEWFEETGLRKHGEAR